MAVKSQNGWPAYPDTRHFTRFTAAGQGWWAANDDVAVVFTEFIERFHREVESITGPVLDDWSYANRLVRGSTSVVSNHGSATGLDINALRHGRGRHGTFTAVKAEKVRAIRDDITDAAGRPVLRLGMDFKTIVDDMHVEICAGERAVRQAADKIRRRNRAAAAQKEENMDLTKENLRDIADAVWSLQVIKLTEAAAGAIGSGDAHEGQAVSAQYLLQWPPLVRRSAREDDARDDLVQRTVDALTASVSQLGRIAAHGGMDPDVFAAAVADKLAARLKS